MTPSVYLMKCYISEPVVVVLIGCDAMWQIKPTNEMKKESSSNVLSHLHLVILADAFIQSDLHMCDLQCIHILHFTLMAHCTSGAIRGSVSCSRTLRQGIELANLLITK